MQRVTVTLDDELMEELDRVIALKGYQNRSEAIRDLARAGIREAIIEEPSSKECVAILTYVYDHTVRELSKRLVRSFHDHHHLSLATTRFLLDHDNSMEITVMKGRTSEVQKIGERIIAERGVRHGRLLIIPVEVETHHHRHGDLSASNHSHIRVL